MKTPDDIQEIVEIPVSVAMSNLCKALGLAPEELFSCIQADLTGGSGKGHGDETMLIQFYVAVMVSHRNQLDRGKVESFLNDFMAIREYLKRHEFDEESLATEAIERYCQNGNIK